MDYKKVNKFAAISIIVHDAGYTYKDPDINIIFVLNGQINLHVEENNITLNKNDIYVINSQLIYEFDHFDDASGIILAKFTISLSYFASFVSEKNFYLTNEVSEDKSEETKVLLRKMLKDYSSSSIDEVSLIQISDYYQLLHLLKKNYLLKDNNDAYKVSYDERKRRIINFIENNYTDNVSLSDIARHMNLTDAYLSRYFKKAFGMTSTEYLYNIRLEHAKNDLLTSNKSLTEITFDNGFPNVSTFDKRFKEKYSLSPSEYKKNNRLEAKDNSFNELESLQNLKAYFNDDNFSFSDTNLKIRNIKCSFNKYVPYKKIFNIAVNVGPIEGLLNQDIQEAVILAHQEIGFQYARVWDIFSHSMISSNNTVKNPNYTKLYHAIDFLLGNNIKPIVEIGDKRRIAQAFGIKSQDDYLYVFEDYKEFLAYLDALFMTLTSHYDIEEVASWKIEVPFYPSHHIFKDKIPYINYLNDIRRLIRKYIPSMPIGGPGINLGEDISFLEETLKNWNLNSSYPDYYTFIFYPEKKNIMNLTSSLNKAISLANQYNLPNKDKIIISEWNMTTSDYNNFNDSLWKANYLIKNYMENMFNVNGIFFGQLSDVMTDFFDSQTILNGSAGLLNKDGITKPTFLSLRLMKHLQNYLIDQGEDYIITRNEYGKITLLVFNYVDLNHLYYLKDEKEINFKNLYTFLDNPQNKTFHIQINNLLADGSFLLRHHYINNDNGNLVSEWEKFKYLNNIKNEDIDYLKKIVSPRIAYTVENSVNKTLNFDIELKPLEIRCISIEPYHGK